MSEQELKSNIKKLRSLEMCTPEWFTLLFKLRNVLFERGESPSHMDYILFVMPI